MNNEVVSIEPVITEITLERVHPITDEFAHYMIKWKEAFEEKGFKGTIPQCKAFTFGPNGEEEARDKAIAYARELRELAASGKNEKRETIEF